MSFQVRGHCPGALAPMQTGDGLLVRLKPRGNQLTSRQCTAIAQLAQRFGNGILDLTSRANLQLRGVDAAEHDELIEALREHSLVDDTADAEARRNVMLSPFAGPEGKALASELENTLAASGLELPGKFGFAVDTGAQPVLQLASADIRIERRSNGGLLVRADGERCGIAVTEHDAVNTVIALAEWFLATTARALPPPPRRMAALIANGSSPPDALRGKHAPAAPRHLPLPGELNDGALFVSAEFGQLSADTLMALAPFAPLMLTPWRMLRLETAPADTPQAAPRPIDRLMRVIDDAADLIIDPRDPRLRVVACVGAPACAQGLQPTQALARTLADTLAPSNTLHVSGCAKGCASRAVASLTLVGTPDGFDVVVNGNSFATPEHHSLQATDARIAALAGTDNPEENH